MAERKEICINRAARVVTAMNGLRCEYYGLKPDTPEPEIVAHLFKLYAERR